MRYSSLFRSRWLALLWSAGIIWTAVEVSESYGPRGDDAAHNVADQGDADLNQLQGLVAKLASK